MYEWTQDRMLIITAEKVYNLKKTKVKRAIAITKLGGISKSVVGNRNEFTFHVPSEYDDRFLSDR